MIIITAMAVLAVYIGYYIMIPFRDHDYGHHSGEYYHFRYVSHLWEYYLFMPAAFIESRLIWVWPRPFVGHPSWTAVPQVLIYKDAGKHMKRFRASSAQVYPSI